MAASADEKAQWPIIKEETLTDFIVKCMQKAGSKEEPARLLAEVLLMGDKRGHYSHGINRLGKAETALGLSVAHCRKWT